MRQVTQPVWYGSKQAHERGEKRPTAKTNGGGQVKTLVFHVGALRWIQPEPLGRLAHRTRGRVLDVSHKRLSGRANEWITGIGAWKDPTRDHRITWGGCGEATERRPAEEGVELEAAEGWYICKRVDFIFMFLSRARRSILSLPFSSVVTIIFLLSARRY